MVFGSAVRSAHPRARILSIDISKASTMPGVLLALTADDVPGEKVIGHIKRDWPVLIPVGGLTRTQGDAVALLAAESREVLETAKKLVKIEYEVLPAVFSPEEAMAPGAPPVHEEGNLLSEEHLVRGDAEGKIKASKYVVTHHYSTPATDHAFLEPECAVARKESDGSVTIWSGDQGIFQTRRECAELLGLPEDRVRVCAKSVGGGFGGKEDMSVQHHAALLACYLDVPVKVALTRQESILIHPKRHAMEMDFTTACDENGILTAMKAVLIADTGAYASLGGPVLQRACTHAAGPYNYQDVDILGRAVYTDNPPAGAFRGFGVPQSCFAAECNLNELAKLAGISPWEIRYRNAIRPGQVLPNGQIADPDAALRETLEAVKPYFDANPQAGIACALKNSGLGVGVPDTGRCRLHVEDGVVHVRTSAACIGQGVGTVCLQYVCEITGLLPDRVVWDAPDTSTTPDAGNTTASRQTLFTGEATGAGEGAGGTCPRRAGGRGVLRGIYRRHR
jgi:selenium-dependent xanthine dehydrogenase